MAINNRLFFALWPREGIRMQIASATDVLCAHDPLEGRRLNPERYHLTLKYIGDNVQPRVEAAALKVADDIVAPPFRLCLDQVGSFRNADIPVWLGPSVIPPELIYLAESLGRAFGDRPRRGISGFLPHLTILREARMQLTTQAIKPIVWPVDEFVLIRSVFRPQADYEVLQRYPLCASHLPDEPQKFDLLGDS